MKYDVVVVGGRLAGSTSSFFASNGGLDVLMIEKRQEIGTPVQCAEFTTKDTFETLEMKPSKKLCAQILMVLIFMLPMVSISVLMAVICMGSRKDMF